MQIILGRLFTRLIWLMYCSSYGTANTFYDLFHLVTGFPNENITQLWLQQVKYVKGPLLDAKGKGSNFGQIFET